MTAFLKIERDGPVVTLTLNQPELRNPLTGNSAADEFVVACNEAATPATTARTANNSFIVTSPEPTTHKKRRTGWIAQTGPAQLRGLPRGCQPVAKARSATQHGVVEVARQPRSEADPDLSPEIVDRGGAGGGPTDRRRGPTNR